MKDVFGAPGKEALHLVEDYFFYVRQALRGQHIEVPLQNGGGRNNNFENATVRLPKNLLRLRIGP